MSHSFTLLSLPRELRDEIISYLITSSYVYTSSEKPDTSNLHRTTVAAKTYVDTRIYLPCRIAPNVLGVCRQLRYECLEYHGYILQSTTHSLSTATEGHDSSVKTTSNALAERLGLEVDEEIERLGDSGVRITLEAFRSQRGKFGYSTPIRDELSPRFLALLPLIERTRRLRLVIWPGFDWWNGSRPRATRMVNGRRKFDDTALSDKPDAVSFAIGKVLEQLPQVEELVIEIQVHVGQLASWDLPNAKWENIQYWLDGSVAREGGKTLKGVRRTLAAVWDPKLVETFYEQQESKVDGGETWHIKRRGDMRTPKVRSLAEPGELEGEEYKVVDEEFDKTY